MRITREDVLVAIDRENLTVDTWCRSDEETCRYCAVGAVLSQAGTANWQMPLTAKSVTKGQCMDDDSLPAALEDKNWLGALSIKWEQLGYKKAAQLDVCPIDLTVEHTEELKPTLKAWVLKTLPEGVIYEGAL